MRKWPSLVGPAGVDIPARPIVAIVAIEQLPGAGGCDGRRPDGQTQCAQSGCDCRLVKHDAYEFHASAAFITLEDVDFESTFEKLSPGDVSLVCLADTSCAVSGLRERRNSEWCGISVQG